VRICVYGAGAIGGHVAARLAQGARVSGAEVSVVARGAHLRAMQERGLRVQARDGLLECRPRATDDARTLGPQDAVLVTVKAPSLPEVAAGIGPLLREDTPVAFVMNGIPWWYFDRTAQDGARLPELDPGEAIRAAVGVPRTLGAVVYSAAIATGPGVITALAEDSRVVIGELDGGMTPRVRAIAEAIAAGGGMGGEAVPDIRRAVWAKLLGNIMTGPLCVLGRHDMGTLLADPAIRAAAVRAGDELVAVARAYGFELGGSVAARVARSAGLAHRPSILQDLEAGRPMEVEALWRAPLALARRAGVPTPQLDLVVSLASRAAQAAGLWRPVEGET
jgi:2-dehydropantoate 2-reductase